MPAMRRDTEKLTQSTQCISDERERQHLICANCIFLRTKLPGRRTATSAHAEHSQTMPRRRVDRSNDNPHPPNEQSLPIPCYYRHAAPRSIIEPYYPSPALSSLLRFLLPCSPSRGPSPFPRSPCSTSLSACSVSLR